MAGVDLSGPHAGIRIAGMPTPDVGPCEGPGAYASDMGELERCKVSGAAGDPGWGVLLQGAAEDADPDWRQVWLDCTGARVVPESTGLRTGGGSCCGAGGGPDARSSTRWVPEGPEQDGAPQQEVGPVVARGEGAHTAGDGLHRVVSTMLQMPPLLQLLRAMHCSVEMLESVVLQSTLCRTPDTVPLCVVYFTCAFAPPGANARAALLPEEGGGSEGGGVEQEGGSSGSGGQHGGEGKGRSGCCGGGSRGGCGGSRLGVLVRANCGAVAAVGARQLTAVKGRHVSELYDKRDQEAVTALIERAAQQFLESEGQVAPLTRPFILASVNSPSSSLPPEGGISGATTAKKAGGGDDSGSGIAGRCSDQNTGCGCTCASCGCSGMEDDAAGAGEGFWSRGGRVAGDVAGPKSQGDRITVVRRSADGKRRVHVELRAAVWRLFEGAAPQVYVFEHDVSEVKRVEENIRCGNLFDELGPDVIFEFDSAGMIVNANRSCSRLLGFDDSELIGRSGFELLHEDDRGWLVSMHKMCLSPTFNAMDQEATTCFRRLRKDGSYMWVEAKGRNFLCEDGVHSIVIERDVTRRVLLEQDGLKAKAFEEVSCDMNMELSKDGVILRVSRASEMILGQEPAEMVGRLSVEFIAPEDRPVFQGLLERLVPEEPIDIEFRRVHRSGALVWVQCKGKLTSVVTQVGGCFAWGGTKHTSYRLIVVERDISVTKALHREAFRARQFALTCLDINIEFARDGRVMRVSPSCEKVLGYTVEEILGRSCVEFLHPEDVPLLRGCVDMLFQQMEVMEGAERDKEGDSASLYGFSEDEDGDGGQSQSITPGGGASSGYSRAVTTRGVAASTGVLSSGASRAGKLPHTPQRQQAGESCACEPSAEVELEYRRLHKNGRLVWVEMKGRLMRFEGMVTMACVERDISKRKLLEEDAVRAQAFQKASPDMLIELDAAGVITRCSPSCSNILGYMPTELVGHASLDFVIDDDKALVSQLFRNMHEACMQHVVDHFLYNSQGGLPRCTTSACDAISDKGLPSGLVKFRRRHKSGRIIWVDVNYRVVTNPREKAYMVYCVERDVTSRVAQQALQEKLAQTLQQEEAEKKVTLGLRLALKEALQASLDDNDVADEDDSPMSTSASSSRSHSFRSETPRRWDTADPRGAGLSAAGLAVGSSARVPGGGVSESSATARQDGHGKRVLASAVVGEEGVWVVGGSRSVHGVVVSTHDGKVVAPGPVVAHTGQAPFPMSLVTAEGHAWAATEGTNVAGGSAGEAIPSPGVAPAGYVAAPVGSAMTPGILCGAPSHGSNGSIRAGSLAPGALREAEEVGAREERSFLDRDAKEGARLVEIGCADEGGGQGRGAGGAFATASSEASWGGEGRLPKVCPGGQDEEEDDEDDDDEDEEEDEEEGEALAGDVAGAGRKPAAPNVAHGAEAGFTGGRAGDVPREGRAGKQAGAPMAGKGPGEASLPPPLCVPESWPHRQQASLGGPAGEGSGDSEDRPAHPSPASPPPGAISPSGTTSALSTSALSDQTTTPPSDEASNGAGAGEGGAGDVGGADGAGVEQGKLGFKKSSRRGCRGRGGRKKAATAAAVAAAAAAALAGGPLAESLQQHLTAGGGLFLPPGGAMGLGGLMWPKQEAADYQHGAGEVDPHWSARAGAAGDLRDLRNPSVARAQGGHRGAADAAQLAARMQAASARQGVAGAMADPHAWAGGYVAGFGGSGGAWGGYPLGGVQGGVSVPLLGMRGVGSSLVPGSNVGYGYEVGAPMGAMAGRMPYYPSAAQQDVYLHTQQVHGMGGAAVGMSAPTWGAGNGGMGMGVGLGASGGQFQGSNMLNVPLPFLLPNARAQHGVPHGQASFGSDGTAHWRG
eukprot:jgi/Mesvir1/28190/Mv04746-RA.3